MRSVEEIFGGHPMFMNIAVQYLRPKLTMYAKETLQNVIRELIADKDLNLEIDPVAVSPRMRRHVGTSGSDTFVL